MTDTERAAFLEERRHRIGGSDVAGILGLSKWSTPVSIFLDKIGMSEGQPETEAMRRGTILEDPVALCYAMKMGYRVYPQHHAIVEQFRVAHIDRIVDIGNGVVFDDKGDIVSTKLLECKTARDPWENGVPDYYIVQGDWYMIHVPSAQSVDFACKHSVFGYSQDTIETLAAIQKRVGKSQEANEYYTEFVSRFGNDNFDIFTVERNDDRNVAILERVTEFWQKHVEAYFKTGDLAMCAPQPINEEDVRALWQKHTPNKLFRFDLGDIDTHESTETRKVLNAVVEKEKADTEIGRLKEISDKCKFVIQSAMQDAEAIVDEKGRSLYTFRGGKPKSEVDWEALARSFKPTAEQIEKFTRRGLTSRSFRASKQLPLVVGGIEDALAETAAAYAEDCAEYEKEQAEGGGSAEAEQIPATPDVGVAEGQTGGEDYTLDNTPFPMDAKDRNTVLGSTTAVSNSELAEAESVF